MIDFIQQCAICLYRVYPTTFYTQKCCYIFYLYYDCFTTSRGLKRYDSIFSYCSSVFRDLERLKMFLVHGKYKMITSRAFLLLFYATFVLLLNY